MTFLAIALCFEAILLLRRGMRPLTAQISGSSMEPHLAGPRLLFRNSSSQLVSSYALDSLRPNRPVDCQYTSDRDNSFDLLTALGSPGMVTEGETVQYYLWKRMAALRAAKNRNRIDANPPETFRGIERGDLIVIQDPDEETREVKRIVGFPGESIDIIDGDLWINQRRWRRDLNQILQHVVLLDCGDERSSSHWNFGGWLASSGSQVASPQEGDGKQSLAFVSLPQSLTSPSNLSESPEIDSAHHACDSMEFRLRSGGLITNELRWNAHDSHALIPVADIGFAIEIQNGPSDWQLAVSIRSQNSTMIMVERNGDSIIVSSSQKEVSKTISTDRQAHWLIFMTIDGETIVADQNSEWLRESNSENRSTEEESSFELDSAPFSIDCHHGEVELKQWVAFRDLCYRGAGDSPTQSLPSHDGIVVLGDNVSISNDSRQRWENGLSIDAIRGIVDIKDRGWDALMKQKRQRLVDQKRDPLQKQTEP